MIWDPIKTFVCLCKEGYKGKLCGKGKVKKSCHGNYTNKVPIHQYCSFKCQCEIGFSSDGRTSKGLHSTFLNQTKLIFKLGLNQFENQLTPSCYYFIDIDECSQRSHTCDKNATCTNTDGSFKCQCEIGFSGDGHTCKGLHSTFLNNQAYSQAALTPIQESTHSIVLLFYRY